jgi:hypothetical protein
MTFVDDDQVEGRQGAANGPCEVRLETLLAPQVENTLIEPWNTVQQTIS